MVDAELLVGTANQLGKVVNDLDEGNDAGYVHIKRTVLPRMRGAANMLQKAADSIRELEGDLHDERMANGNDTLHAIREALGMHPQSSGKCIVEEIVAAKRNLARMREERSNNGSARVLCDVREAAGLLPDDGVSLREHVRHLVAEVAGAQGVADAQQARIQCLSDEWERGVSRIAEALGMEGEHSLEDVDVAVQRLSNRATTARAGEQQALHDLGVLWDSIKAAKVALGINLEELVSETLASACTRVVNDRACLGRDLADLRERYGKLITDRDQALERVVAVDGCNKELAERLDFVRTELDGVSGMLQTRTNQLGAANGTSDMWERKCERLQECLSASAHQATKDRMDQLCKLVSGVMLTSYRKPLEREVVHMVAMSQAEYEAVRDSIAGW